MEKSNIVGLMGWLKSIEPIEEANGMSFKGYRAVVTTERQSKAKDDAIVLVPEALHKTDLAEGMPVMAAGAIQTHKNFTTGKVMVYILATIFEQIKGEHWESENEVTLTGTIGRGTVYRETPNGRRITNIFARIPCELNQEVNCYVPCICWGNTAAEVADWEEGTPIKATGRLQSREYEKALEDGATEVRTCYEVSIRDIERA